MDSTLSPLKEIGDRYKDFTLSRVVPLDEIRCVLREVRHEPSGATVMHIANDDPENVFCLSFRTTPECSDGVAHILEHTVLCGSKKYPVKDPFFSMTRRSLNTFMNAFTGQDFTCYPAASQVKEDFYHLLEVYADAVFKPKLEHFAFLQEGHRLEFADPDDASTDLTYKGIVFNEMKGAYTSPSSRFWEGMGNALFPDVTYGISSGGNPRVIPTLSYEDLKKFHSDYYNPGRCLFYFYGNLPLHWHLDFLDTHVFPGVSNPGPLPKIPKQKRFTQPVEKFIEYPIAENESKEGKTYVGFGWLTCHVLDQKETLALSILDIILMDNDASPLKKALLKSQLCTEAEMSLVEDINEIPMIMQLKGCEPENAVELERIVRATLEQVVSDGISQDAVESALHQLEFARAEIMGDAYPYGLSLFLRAGLLRQHDGKPEEALRIHSLFDELRRSLRDPQFLPGLIEKYFLRNPHSVRLVMAPNAEVSKQEEEEERNELAERKKKLTEDEARSIVKQARILKSYQELQEDENIECLPDMSLEDVPVHSRQFELKDQKMGGTDLYHHDAFTNQIVYADVFFDLPALKTDELWLAQLMTHLLPQVGSGHRDYATTLGQLQEHTGGLEASLSLYPQARNPNKFAPALNLEGRALHRKAPQFFELLRDMIVSPNFEDVSRLKELLAKHYTSLEQSLTNGALRYATNLAACQHSPAAVIHQNWSGLGYFSEIRSLIKNFDSRVGSLVQDLQGMAEKLLCLEHSDLVISTDKKSYESYRDERFWGLLDFRPRKKAAGEWNVSTQDTKDQGRIIPSQVAFTSQSLPGVPYTHQAAAPLSLAAKICNNRILHQRIREQGGAYGGGASYVSTLGSFGFYAYRDPNLSRTVAAFEEAVSMLGNGDFSERNLKEAKLEIIQKLDSPVSPGERGALAYSWKRQGLDLDTRQSFRHKLLACTREDIQRTVEKELKPGLEKACTVSFAGKELLEREAPSMKQPFELLEI